jgi:hypothetical protein
MILIEYRLDWPENHLYDDAEILYHLALKSMYICVRTQEQWCYYFAWVSARWSPAGHELNN